MNLALASGQLDVGRVRAYLAQCRDLDEVRDIRDQAEAIARVARCRDDAEGLSAEAAAVARRAERRLGELLAAMPKATGNRGRGRPRLGDDQSESPKSDFPTLADRGISGRDSMRWQALAAVPSEAFDAELDACVEARKAPTYAQLMRLVKGESATDEPEPFHILDATGELRAALEHVIAKAMGSWPEASRCHIPALLRDVAEDVERDLGC